MDYSWHKGVTPGSASEIAPGRLWRPYGCQGLNPGWPCASQMLCPLCCHSKKKIILHGGARDSVGINALDLHATARSILHTWRIWSPELHQEWPTKPGLSPKHHRLWSNTSKKPFRARQVTQQQSTCPACEVLSFIPGTT